MTGQSPLMSRAELEALAIAKAREDASFKEYLLNDPKAALEQEGGQALPANVEIRVLEENKNTLYIVLPFQGTEPGELPSASQDVRLQLLSRALEDETFKQQLLAQPRATVQTFMDEMALGYRLPEDLALNFLEETDDVRYLVLPIPEEQEGELADWELETVAGGAKDPRPGFGTVYGSPWRYGGGGSSWW